MKSLDNIPKYNISDPHLWADYIELLCCWDIDHEYNKAQFIDLIRPVETDLAIDYAIEIDNRRPEEIDDKYLERAEELFKYFEMREMIYKEHYPFTIQNGSLKLKDEALNNEMHLIYIYLLCCSSLNYFNDELPVLTSEFEVISFLAASLVLPHDTSLYNVGKNNLGIEQKYRGNLYSKLKSLSIDIGEVLIINENEFPPTNNGDGGLDIIGWVNFKDNLNSRILFVGQSKCSEDWNRHTSAGQLLKSYINLNNAPNDMFFIPFCFRNLDQLWHQKHKVSGYIVFDRARIIGSIGKNGTTPIKFCTDSQSISLLKNLLLTKSEVI